MLSPAWPLSHRARVVLALVGTLAVAPSGARTYAASPDSAPALPAPSGPVINVSTEAQLQNAVASAPSGATILIAPGTYQLSGTLYFNRSVSDVVLRGATNNRTDVVLAGPGMANAGSVPFGVWTGGGVTRLTIANLTIRDIYYHPIILNPGTQQPRIYNVRLVNAGEQFVKANPDGAGGGVNGGIVEYSVIEYDTVARSDYTNGVDVHTGSGWIIRHNLFRRIRSTQGLAGPAILMWNKSRDTVVEGNTFIDNHRDISLGLITRTPNDHTGGIVRNNMIVRTPGAGGDVAIAVADSPGTKVLHNSIWMGGAYPNAIEYRFPDAAGLAIMHNLTDAAITARDGAVAVLTGNVTTATAGYFASIAGGDLHLTGSATLAIDRVAALADAPTDWDGETRPAGAVADIGADERSAAPPPPPPIEICGDGIDNDGDGLIDEGCPPPPPIEICGDGLDNDGDGLIDEGCPPPPPPPPTELCGDGLDNDGDGLIDEGCTMPPGDTAPGVPARLTGEAHGRSVTLGWLAPISGGEVSGYVLEAGFTPGTTVVSLPLGAPTGVRLPDVAPGTYRLRVRATGPGGAGGASNEVTVTVGACTASTPPRALAAAMNGPRAMLTWVDDFGCEGRTFRLVVGTSAGASDLGAVDVPSPPFEVTVPGGPYFVRVGDARGSGTSNEVRVAASGPCRPPDFAVALSGRSLQGMVDLRWEPVTPSLATAADAATPVFYVLEAGRTPSGTEIGVLPMGRRTTFTTPAPAGRYHVRVRAANACGQGPASNDVSVTVP